MLRLMANSNLVGRLKGEKPADLPADGAERRWVARAAIVTIPESSSRPPTPGRCAISRQPSCLISCSQSVVYGFPIRATRVRLGAISLSIAIHLPVILAS